MPSTLVSTGFTQEAFDSFLASRNEPAWLSDLRCAAWERFLSLGMPARNDEEWARTDIRLFKLDRFSFPSATPTEAPLPGSLLAEGVTLAGSTATLDSAPAATRLSEKWAAKGVLFGGLSAMLTEHGDLLRPFVERRLVNPNQDKFSALNAAAWADGALLYVPRRVTIDEPLLSLSAMTDGGVDLNKTLVILEEGAEATLLAETASNSPHAGGLHNGSIELMIEPGARLRFVTLQNWGDQTWHFAHQMAHIARGGHIQWTIGALGSRLAKVNQHVALTGQDAEAQVNGVMFTQGRQHLSYNTHQHHKAAHCRSDLLYKAALQDQSRTVWRGMIKVDRGAQRTDAYQRNDNLMLSRDARADSIPGLEIEADDVRCTHGSTSGRVDEQQVFYAMTRGYTRQEAVRMIVEGFFQQVFDRIPIESVSEALGEAIGKRVRAIAS
jgi:Fe-S cluster assembly protein SufD